MFLEVSADPSQVSIARLFVASAVRGEGFPDDLVEDARLAVSEAVSDMIERQGASGMIKITVTPSGEALDVHIESPGAPPIPGDDSPLRLAVISSLFPEADLSSDKVSFRIEVPV